MLAGLARDSLRRPLTHRPSFARLFHYCSPTWAVRRIVQPFKLADIGEGITECEVIKWSVKPASAVQMFDPLCEVQSDKASVEITSPFEGVVKELLVKEGQVAKVGENLCTIEVVDETSGEAEAINGESSDAETISEDATRQRMDNQENNKIPSESARQPHPLDPRAQPDERSSESSTALALPSVRHFAKERGVDLSLLSPGSGKNGRIEKKDVEAFLSRASSQGAPGLPSSQRTMSSEVVVELSRTRHAMWNAMVKSLEIPHFGYSTYLDLTTLHNIIPILNTHIPPHYLVDPPPEKPLAVNPSAVYPAPPAPDVPPTGKYSRLTYLPFLLKTLALAMHDWPLFRSSITPTPPPGSSSDSENPTLTTPPKSPTTLTIRPHADINIALSTPTGLYTPTIQNVSSHSLYALASHLAHVSALGRRTPCGLGPGEMPRAGGTLTVSNVGAIGAGEFASPVLVPGGGVAIVAVGRAKWVRDEERGRGSGSGRGGEGERRLKVGVSWSADHRVVEGAELAAFVECWRGYVENPERLIAVGV